MQEAFYMPALALFDPYSAYTVSQHTRPNQMQQNRYKDRNVSKLRFRRYMWSGLFLTALVGILFIVLGAKYLGDSLTEKHNATLIVYLCGTAIVTGGAMVLCSIIISGLYMWGCKKKETDAESTNTSNQDTSSNIATDLNRRVERPPPYAASTVVATTDIGSGTNYRCPTLRADTESGLVLPPAYSKEPPQYSLLDQNIGDTLTTTSVVSTKD